MHGDDPVAWQIWGEEALAKAKASNKPLFISSGYFACHWCHVMQRESYKTRKSLHCSINISYLSKWTVNWSRAGWSPDRFREAHRGSAGWPLNVFLTPDGYPLVGLTYAPTESFMGLLIRLQKPWQERADELVRPHETRHSPWHRKSPFQLPIQLM